MDLRDKSIEELLSEIDEPVEYDAEPPFVFVHPNIYADLIYKARKYEEIKKQTKPNIIEVVKTTIDNNAGVYEVFRKRGVYIISEDDLECAAEEIANKIIREIKL